MLTKTYSQKGSILLDISNEEQGVKIHFKNTKKREAMDSLTPSMHPQGQFHPTFAWLFQKNQHQEK